MTFRSAVLTKINTKLNILNLKIPKLKKGQVLVKMDYSSICQSQIQEIYGGRNNEKWIPHLMGHEGVGKVIEIGNNVNKCKKGDSVIVTWLKTSGIESDKIVYRDLKNNKINAGKATTFNEMAIISENRLIKKNKKIKDKHASLFGCALPTGAGLVLSQNKMSINSNIAVIGLGGIGFFSLLTLKYLGFKNITVIDNNRKKLKLAKSITKGHFYLSDEKFINKTINDRKFKKFDYCFESAGKIETIELGFKLISTSGKCVFASHPKKNEYLKIDPHELISGKKIEGVWGSHYDLEIIMPKLIKIYLNNLSIIDKVFNKMYKFIDINKGIEDFKIGKSLRPIIKFNK